MMGKRRDVPKLSPLDLSRRGFLVNTAIVPLLLWLPGRAAASTIHQLEGLVYVNNRPATDATSIKAGATRSWWRMAGNWP